jgi:phosphate ABC transporter phosphate-binding protein
MRTPMRSAALIAFMVVAAGALAGGQRVASLEQAKTLFIENFSGDPQAAALRTDLMRRLERDHRFRLVSTAADADAVVQGNGKIWVRGYVSTSGRTPSNSREAVYAGYLSLELIGADRQPLWSWLVTPGSLHWKSIVDELADRGADKLLEAARSPTTSSSGTSEADKLGHTELTGAGATFPAPLYQKWFEDFEQIHPGVTVRYAPVGSQAGVDRLTAGDLDFAGSDVAPDVAGGAAPGAKLRRVASVMGAVVPIYNLPGDVRDLHFTPQALADIYLGKVRRWNDPEIRQSNHGANLPDADIVVVHRQDGSGTTWVWSGFLSKVSPAWASAVGRGVVLHWPVGLAAEGNEGVAETVQKTPNSIGYAELAYAIQRQLSFAGVRNHAGQYVHADLDSLDAAARSAGADNADISDAPGKNAYPIAAFTWLVLPAETKDPAKKAALDEMLRWVLTTGQKECSALAYEPLPREIAAAQLRELGIAP